MTATAAPLKYEIYLDEDGNEAISIVYDGQFYDADGTHPRYQEMVQAAVAKNTEELLPLFDPAEAIAKHFEALSERVSVAHGRIYFDHEEVDHVLSDQILEAYREGDVTSWSPFVNFWEKLETCPSQSSREQLYEWLESNHFTITPEGDILCYKGVSSDFYSINEGTAIVDGELVEGKIPNKPGSVVEMPRNQVREDPHSACNVGLHVATESFARSFSSANVLLLIVNPRDVVSVPDGGKQKMRVCRYLVKDVVTKTGEYKKAVYVGIDDEEADEQNEVVDEAAAVVTTTPPKAVATKVTFPATNSQSPLDQEPTYKKLMGFLTNPRGDETKPYKPYEVVDWLERTCGVITTKDSLRRFKSRHGL